ncbi:MAG: hypothetical protein J5U19_15490 [Candidatus Methanoperedens sp.]|nr:hypothetical protein [Candidatus Methanoperedens sp.]
MIILDNTALSAFAHIDRLDIKINLASTKLPSGSRRIDLSNSSSIYSSFSSGKSNSLLK